MSALFGFICGHLECARMKDASRAMYGVYSESVGYVNKFCSVWSLQCETLRLLYAFASYLNDKKKLNKKQNENAYQARTLQHCKN